MELFNKNVERQTAKSSISSYWRLGWMWCSGDFCLLHFALAKRGMVPQVRFCLAAKYHLVPASVQQLPPTVCPGNSSLTLYWSQQQLFVALPAFAAVTARLSVLGAAVVLPASLCNNCLDHGSRCQRSVFSCSCRQMGRTAAFLGCGGRLKPVPLKWGVIEGL